LLPGTRTPASEAGPAGVRENVRRRARRPVGAALAVALRASNRQLGLALCHHSVGDPQGRSGWALVPSLGTGLFADQLRHLRARYRLVRARDLPEAIATRRRGERFPLAITFDDDLAAHAGDTSRLLRRLDIPATFFLGGATLEEPRPYFWQALQAALDAGMSPADPLLPRVEDPGGRGGAHRLATVIRELDRDERDELCSILVERIGGPPEPGLREDAVRALADAGFEIGFHTRDHEALDLLDDDALRRALREGRERLEGIAQAPLHTIAYPFGLADERVADAARAAGFRAGFTLEAQPVSAAADPLLIGRYQPSFVTAGHTATELARGLARAVVAPVPELGGTAASRPWSASTDTGARTLAAPP
jgi:peptidoglycan/xylan/chitin deacetylase (PgdA/CDA1 family)